MNSKRIFSILAFLIGILVIWFFVWNRKTSQPNPPQIVSVQDQGAAHYDGQNLTQTQNVHQASTQPQNTPTTISNDKPHSIQEWLERQYNISISFYGKVVDENEVPVSNASIEFEWANAKGEGLHASITSDNLGLFSLTGVKGKGIAVNLFKEGYYTSKQLNQKYFRYSDDFGRRTFSPDTTNPIVFHLRKKGQGEALIHNLQLFGFRTNGPVQYLDLVQGKNSLTPPGDLVVQFTRGERNTDGKYDWSAIISVPEGGIFETDEEFMFFAPEDGYQQSIEIRQSANESDWVSQAKKRFYIKSRSGNIYGRAEATIIPRYQDAAAIDLDYYINPSGSRNLEPK
jgi:hypothetical protein